VKHPGIQGHRFVRHVHGHAFSGIANENGFAPGREAIAHELDLIFLGILIRRAEQPQIRVFHVLRNERGHLTAARDA